MSGWRIESQHLRTLQAAADAWDRKEQAREALLEHGLTYVDGKDMVRAARGADRTR